MDDQIERHQPLITARLIFGPKAFPPPPIIAARMEFPFISVPQQHERSPTPEIRTPRKHSLAPKRQHPTSKIASTSNRSSTPRRHTVDLQTTPRRASTPHVAFEDYVDPGSPLTDLPDEDEHESEEDGEVSKKIPKPAGSAGRPQSGGYNLQDKLTWNDITYESIMVSLLNVLGSMLTKLTGSYTQTGKDEIRHHKKFPWTGYEENQANL
jgi:hypothetical protein